MLVEYGPRKSAFNTELAEELDALEGMFDITIVRFDFLGIQDAMINDPAAFSLANVTDPACPGCGFGIPEPGAEDTVVPNPEEYLFWDDFHFTAAANEILGDAAADLVEATVFPRHGSTGAVPEPATALLLAIGAAAAAVCNQRRRGEAPWCLTAGHPEQSQLCRK